MIDNEAVLARVQQGNIPPNWQIFRASGSPIASAIFNAIFWLIIVSVLEFIFLALNPQFGFSSLGQGDITSVPTLIKLLGKVNILFLLAPIILAVLGAMSAASRTARARDAVLIVFPQGVVQCNRCSDPAKRSFKTLSYADVATIKLHEYTYSSYNSGSQAGTRITKLWLDIVQRNGVKKRWDLDKKFGRPAALAQTIIASHAGWRP